MERDLGNKRSGIKCPETLIPGIKWSKPNVLLEPKVLKERKGTWDIKGLEQKVRNHLSQVLKGRNQNPPETKRPKGMKRYLEPKVRKNFVGNQKVMEALGTGV